MIQYDSINQYNIYEISEQNSGNLITMTVKDLLQQINLDLQQINNTDIMPFDNISTKDLRRLDYNLNFNNNEAMILVRKNSVIFSVDTVRAVILHNKIYFIVPNGADNILKILTDNINKRTLTESFEYYGYDALLQTIRKNDVQNLRNMENEVEILAAQLKKSTFVPLNVQEKLKTLKTTISNLSKHFSLIKNLLDELLNDDEKLLYMNLTLLKNHTIPIDIKNEFFISHREKMSSLFEIYLYDYTDLLFKMNSLNDKIEHEEEYTILKSSLLQNQYMFINMLISILTCVIGFCAYITGLFGMNLDNVIYLQPIHGFFNGVLIATLIFIPLMTSLVVWIMRKHELIPT